MAEEEVFSITEEEYEEQINDSYQLGISSGLQYAAGYFRDKAQAAFLAGKDELAFQLREYMNELSKLSRDKHPNKENLQ